MRATLLVALLAAACAPAPESAPVLVFAAASTADAVEDAARGFDGGPVRVASGGSGTLARQIEAGAEAGLFLSANPEWAEYLEGRGLVAARRDLLANRLVLVVPSGSEGVANPEDLLKANVGRIAIGDPEIVPAGAYAREALRKLGLWNRLERKIVPAGDVRQALLYVERNEAGAAIVYATDARLAEDIRVVYEFDPSLTGPIRYPLVLLKTGAGQPVARRLFEYLSSPQARQTFQRHGFTLP